jgi:diguanylate cyclase (GGDEF)-like protein/PAS domain S-box-containing protein
MKSGMDSILVSEELGIARALTWRYTIALSLVASLSTAAWLSFDLVISKQKSTAAIVNVSGRQRMLSQRTALFSNLLVTATYEERADLRKKLSTAIDLMERSHHGLTHGSDEMGLPRDMSPVVHAMYFEGPDALDVQVESYIQTVRALLRLNDPALTSGKNQLDYITQNAPGRLVSSLDRMVGQYQLEGEAAVQRLEKAETSFWILTLILLVIEAALIFHPFVRHVRSIIAKLQGVTKQLADHQAQLEETILQRTQEMELRSKALAESEELFRLISTTAKDGIIMMDSHELITYWNPEAQRIFGFNPEEIIGTNLHDTIMPERYRKSAHEGFRRFTRFGVGEFVGKTFEIIGLHKKGHEFPIELSISGFRFQNEWHAMGIVRDITDRKKMEEQVKQLAFYDPLTNLPNRRLLNDRLNQVMVASKRTRQFAALMVLDLDNFKPLNDTHGHVVGDLLLVEVAKRLHACVREIDTVARFGGDEFVVLLADIGEEIDGANQHARTIAEKIRIALERPYQLISQGGETPLFVEHSCSASIGVVVFHNQSQSKDNLFKQADMAMYHAKQQGRNQVRFYEGQFNDSMAHSQALLEQQ